MVANSHAYDVILIHLTCYSRTHAIDKITHAFLKNHTHTHQFIKKKIMYYFYQIGSITLGQYLFPFRSLLPYTISRGRTLIFEKFPFAEILTLKYVGKILFKSTKSYSFPYFVKGGGGTHELL